MANSSVIQAFSATAKWGLSGISAAISVTLLGLLLSLRHVEGLSLFIMAPLLALAGLSFLRPAVALMILAAAVPVATWIGRYWNGAVAWPEVLAIAFSAGYVARTAWTQRMRADSLRLPILVFTALVAASLGVHFLVLDYSAGSAALWQQFRDLASGRYFLGSGGSPDIDAAMRLFEGLVLLRAAASVSEDLPSFRHGLPGWVVAGAALASALNIWRLVESALRTQAPITVLTEYVRTLRYNVHYPDVNAAGSYYVLALLVAIGLLVHTKKARWFTAAALALAGLVLSGSRTALVAGGMAFIALKMVRLLPSLRLRTRRPAALGAALAIIVVVTSATFLAMSRNRTPSSTALNIRAEFVRTTLRMVEDYPAFGVGIGQYPLRARDYSSPGLLQLFATDQENAHNNFLQILGELGVVGSVGFLGVLGTAARRSIRSLAPSQDPLRTATVAGLVAFVLTWLGGHPLLIDEPAMTFWLLLGTAAGWSGPSERTGRSGVRTIVIAVVVGAVALSVPARARTQFADRDLEHRGIGVSQWHHAQDGTRYRLGGARSTVFAPTYARVVTVPLRAAQEKSALVVMIRLNGRLANVVRVSSDSWTTLQLVIPPEATGARFARLEFVIEGSDAEQVLMIGKVEPRE